MRHASLFTGIGGFDYAAQLLGWENVFQVEIDDYALQVLEKNFPNVKRYIDIYDLKADKYENKIDVISGGFPCQPFSNAGKKEGKRDNRYLWPQMFRIIQECKPTWVVAENVYGILSIEEGLVFHEVCLDLESQGYEVQSFIIPACSKDAPHRRDRVWVIGYNVGNAQHDGPSTSTERGRVQYASKKPRRKKSVRKSSGAGSSSQDVAHAGGKGFSRSWSVKPGMGRLVDGVSSRVDRLTGLGNAIVPQIAYDIFMTINEVDNDKGRK